jgi:hypothetical protein
MQTSRDRAQINNSLGRHGLATLDDPRGMLQQLGFLVQDHAHLRRMLIKCEPSERHTMYESLRPHLSFEPKPLDVYISEGGADAAARQLPTIGPDGQLHGYSVPEIITGIAEEAIAKVHLTVTCKKCTRTVTFCGTRKADAVQKARFEGWTYNELNATGYEVCPSCD